MGMIIQDSRAKGSTVILDEGDVTSLASDKNQVISCNKGDQLIVENPENTGVVSLGDGQYLQGKKGDKGDAPEHEWQDTSLRFRRPDGSWGWLVDLQGEKGEKGNQGIPGPKGEGIQGLKGDTGPTSFIWAKYADTVTPAPEEMYQEPEGRVYVGLSYNRLIEEGEGDPQEFDYTQYKWSKIQGTDGAPGTPGAPGGPGAPGTGFNWIGEWPAHPTEADIGRPIEEGDTYLNTTDQRVYTYAGGWHTMLNSGGEGPIGPQGAPGGGFQYQGEFDSSPSGALVNWLYLNTNNNLFYVYDGKAWTVATSDGKASTDGAECGNGLRFFTTYNASETIPARPTLDGDTNGWNPNPHFFPPGDIKWVAQKIATDPQLGTWNDPIDIELHGFRGPVGFRGSQSIMTPIPGWNGIWDDNIAASVCTGGAPQEWDVVTLYKSEDPEVQITKRWSLNPQNGVWEWLDYNYVFLGDVLVDGTVDGTAFNAATTITAGKTADKRAFMSGEGSYRFWAGSDDPIQAPFWVDEDGNGKFSGTLVLGGEEVNNIDELTGRELRTIFRNAATQPATPPNGNPPAGWSYSPTSPNTSEFTWACTAWFKGDGTQDTVWTAPSKWGGNPADGSDYDDSWIYPNQDALSIKSDNYQSGVNGWAIDKTGNAEFNNAVVRGTIYATDGEFSGTIYATDGFFQGTIYANQLVGGTGDKLALDLPQTPSMTNGDIHEWFYFDVPDWGRDVTVKVPSDDNTSFISEYSINNGAWVTMTQDDYQYINLTSGAKNIRVRLRCVLQVGSVYRLATTVDIDIVARPSSGYQLTGGAL